ncbi:MAG: PaaI family thioesterase [Actinomycetaceae bacterium]|nr:PaaI family thioesterase [Actinomycetaceae bacterium]
MESKDFAEHTLMHRMNMQLVSLSPSECIIRMPVEGNRQRAGFLHGGASAALVETAGSFAANEHAQSIATDTPLAAVGVELSIQHVSSAADGFVTATATGVQLGRTRCVHRVDVKNEDGEIISTALISNQIIKARA